MAKQRLSEQRARTVARELLSFRGWNIAPLSSQGQVLEESEYKHFPVLDAIFKGASKTGGGDGKPDFLVVDSATGLRPLLIIETKATLSQASSAIADAIHYADACQAEGHDVLAVGIAGAEKEICSVKVKRKIGNNWRDLTLEGEAIDWVPSLAQVKTILSGKKTEVRPERPSESILAGQANKLNEILRECKIKDEYRPVYVATFMLGLWKGEVSIEEDVVLKQINANAQQALQKAGKPHLAQSLRVDDENDILSAKAWEIIDILKKLNIRSFHQEHDYLGQLYETFFRYTGGNTIGQYFTPRHVIAFMCDLIEVGQNDVVFDPACGTGGFLIGALNRMLKQYKLTYEDGIKKVRNNLFGMDTEPATAALCVTNMILRGDGNSGVIKGNCFALQNYPPKPADCVLLNPPFPHKKTDTPPTDFIDRGLCSLKNRGMLAAVVPYSLLVNVGDWHKKILKENTLVLAATLPPDLFAPYSSFNTAVLVLQKGVPHGSKDVFFCRIENDGFKVKKSARVPRSGSQLALLLKAFRAKSNMPELCAVEQITPNSKEWSPEAYIKNAVHSDAEFMGEFSDTIREQAAFYLQYGYRLSDGIIKYTADVPLFSTADPTTLANLTLGEFKIADYFDVQLGGSEEIEDLEDGDLPVVSTSEFMNGVTTWRSHPEPFKPPVITVATDGSTCSSFVQEFPFYAFYKVAVLSPKEEYRIPIDALYYIAYLLRRERWRYVYARKFGKARINLTSLIGPVKVDGTPDFEKMAELTRDCPTYPVIQNFRKGSKLRSSS